MMISARMIPLVPKYSLLTTLFAALILLLSPAAAQQAAPSNLANNIDRHLAQLHLAEQQQLPPAKTGYLWATLASAYQDAADSANAFNAYDHAIALLAKDPAVRANYATALDNLGSLYLEYGRTKEAETARKKALTLRLSIGNPIEIARSQQHLAEVALAVHHFKQAEEQSNAAYKTLATTNDPDARSNLTTRLSALVTLTYAQCMQSRPAEGLQNATTATVLAAQSFPPTSVERAHIAMALGFAQWKSGNPTEAEQSIQTGLSTMRTALGERNPMLIAAMYEYRGYLQAMHRATDLALVDRQIEQATAPQPNNPCPNCQVSVNALR